MRRVPTPVSVVTVDVEGVRSGVTVGSLVSLSLEPPLVGISISRQAQLHALLLDGETFGISVLGGTQAQIAQHFARSVPPIALWQGIPLRPGDGPPLIDGAIGWLVCRRVQEVDVGTHTLFIGETVHVELGRPGPALVYARQEYHAL
jgi:flavin reductase (DIM6/NTAB) family NADH-FMN oxidoreductase RutF